MSTSAVSQFSIYNFFSVLLPGVVLLIGFYPLLPARIGTPTAGAIIPLLALGFVFGQFIHIVSVGIERFLDVTSHRDMLQRQLRRPTILSEDTMELFHSTCKEKLSMAGLSDDRVVDSADEKLMDSLYVSVRAYVDFDARGRSQIFQAIYAFCRSIYFAAGLLGSVYVVYSIIVAFGLDLTPSSFGLFPYRPRVAALGFTPAMILNFSLFVTSLTFIAFKKAKDGYREYFLQYLVTEFLLISNGE